MAHGENPPLNITPGAIRFNTDSMKLEYFRIGMEGGATNSYAGIGTLAVGEWVQITTDTPDIQTGGTRGVSGGGNTPAYLTDIEFVTIPSTGNSTDYGDLTDSRGSLTALASRTRAVFACGYSPGDSKLLDFITIASGGTATVFGNNTASNNDSKRYAPSGVANSTRGLIGGGQSVAPGPATPGTQYTDITYITIASTGDTEDFGDLVGGGSDQSACANSTRGIYAGGSPGHNIIDYVTINTLGNAADFGDLNASSKKGGGGGGASATRGLFAGHKTPTGLNVIDYITLASLGDAQDFGDLTTIMTYGSACSSTTRCIWTGGYRNSTRANIIDFVTISTTGDAQDFGDLIAAKHYHTSCSNGHGGLG